MNVNSNKLIPLAGATVLALAVASGCLPASGAPGGSGGAAPCAPAGQGDEGASTVHPERAPLLAQGSFAHGVRWAVCGADPVFDNGLLNLRSDDGGRTWTTTDTGIDMGFAPFHGGDVVEVDLIDATTATIHFASRVAEIDLVYRTNDGGHRWRVNSCQLIDG